MACCAEHREAVSISRRADRGDVRVIERGGGNRDIDAARNERIEQVTIHSLDQFETQAGRFGEQTAHRIADQGAHHCRHCADAHNAALQPAQRCQFIPRIVHFGDDVARVDREQLARRGERHALAAAIEQRMAKPVFHAAHQPAERGLREMGNARGTAKAAGFGNREEGAELAFIKIHALNV